MTLSRIPAAPARERGRPRTFDIDIALDNAMIVFRQKGFHASSIADLSEAMNLTAGSIYKAFKDKRSLFLRVFERYISVRGADLRAPAALSYRQGAHRRNAAVLSRLRP